MPMYRAMMYCCCWLAIGMALSAGMDARAQDAARWSYTAHSWQAQNGLPGQTVQSFAETPDGYLWVGTSEGLARFDGDRFVVYAHDSTPQLEENSIFCLLADHNGVLWIGSEGGGLVQMQGGSFRRYGLADGLSDGFVRALSEDRSGALWIATDNGLFRMRQGHIERIDNHPSMPAGAFHAVHEDRRGRIWAGAAHLYALINGEPHEYRLDGSDSQNRVKSILETEDGSIWVGTVSGLHRLRPGAERFERVRGVEGTIRALCSVGNSEIWAGAIGQGIYRLHYDDHSVITARVEVPATAGSNTILNVFADDEGSLWVGTQAGMVRFSRSPVQLVELPQAADSDFGTVALDEDGSVWSASNELVRIADGRSTPVHLPALGGARARNVLRTRDGALWVGTDGSGLFRIAKSGTTHYTMRDGLPNNFIRCLMEAHNGTLWIGMDEGVSQYDGRSFHNWTTQNGLVYFSTRALLEDHNGDQWIGTDRGITHLHQGRPVYDEIVSALKNEKVWALHEDRDGGIWYGTRTDGLFRWRNGQITHYTHANGLQSNGIFSVLEDQAQNMWMSGPLGVSIVPRAELDAQAQGRTQHLHVVFHRADAGDKPTSLFGGTQPTGVITHAGDAWFPTNRGLWHIRQVSINHPSLQHLVLDSIRVDGRSVPIRGAVALSADSSRIEIGFAAIYLSAQAGLHFHYRMKGFDAAWIDGDSMQHAASYTNLPAGRYQFEVEGWQDDQADQRVSATIEIVKSPHFYRTVWFLALCMVGVALLALLVYQVRMRQVHARYAAVLAERTRLAREMHDTLIQGCASASAMLEAAQGCAPDDIESRQHLIEYASTQIRSTMDEARQAVWNLRRGEQVAMTLPDSLQQMCARAGSDSGLDVQCVIEGQSYELHQQAVHDLTMVAREAVYNAILHGEPQRVEVRLSYRNDSILLSVKDDGRGFDPDTARPDGHYGLQGINERVERFAGVVNIESGRGQGTEVSVNVPRDGIRT